MNIIKVNKLKNTYSILYQYMSKVMISHNFKISTEISEDSCDRQYTTVIVVVIPAFKFI